jgi:CheY-like chemotaxis protein
MILMDAMREGTTMVATEQLTTILMADDDPDDRLLTQQAFREQRLANELRFVEDGEQLIDYLKQQGQYADPSISPRPGLILLDWNMPKKNGREVLAEIKVDPQLKRIPVVVLSTSNAEMDIRHAYDLGANAFISKPVTFEGLAAIVKTLGEHWFGIVELPS